MRANTKFPNPRKPILNFEYLWTQSKNDSYNTTNNADF